MAQSTTVINACDARIMIDNNAGTLTDYSGTMNNASFSLSKDTGSATTFDGGYKIQTDCKREGTISFGVLYSTDLTEARQNFEDWWELGGKRTVQIYPYGTAVGARYYQCEARLNSYPLDITSDSADPIGLSFEAIIDGPLSMLNVAS